MIDNLKNLDHKEAAHQFVDIDGDNSGGIDREEARRFMKYDTQMFMARSNELAELKHQQEIEEEFDRMDINKDGIIQPHEFDGDLKYDE